MTLNQQILADHPPTPKSRSEVTFGASGARTSFFSGVTGSLLRLRGHDFQEVAKVGFEYKNDIEALDKVIEEANELKKEIKKKNKKRIKEELGDMLFASLDVARKLQLNPEISLAKSNEKFSKRWRRLEQLIINDKKEFNDLNLKDFNFYWNKAKIN